ncbi:MAG: hypothetical protein JXQ68_03015 [Campylobacterales bacterium]|nr:hypothetical protein [Campylobacterales bacterium]
MKIIGIILIAIGLIDFGGSYMGFDLWTDFFHVKLPDAVWRFSSYIELIVGFFLFQAGSKKSADEIAE